MIPGYPRQWVPQLLSRLVASLTGLIGHGNFSCFLMNEMLPNACQMRSDLLPRSSLIQLGKPKVGFLTREKVCSFSGGKGAGTAPVLC